MLFFRQLTEDDLPSFTELQDADNDAVTTLGPNKEQLGSGRGKNNTSTSSPLVPSGPGAAVSIKPILQLKPVPEIVKPVGPTTRRPHTFIRFRKYTLVMMMSLYLSLSGGQRLSGPRSLPSQGASCPRSAPQALCRTVRTGEGSPAASRCLGTLTMICHTPGISSPRSQVSHRGPLGSSRSVGPGRHSSGHRQFSSSSRDPSSTEQSNRSRTANL